MADRRLVWRVTQVAAALLVIGLAVRSLAGSWQAFRMQPVDLRANPAWLGAGIATVLVMYAMLIEAWRRVVQSLGQRLDFLAAARIWLLASLGKYLPGKVWAIAGAAVLARQYGVEPHAAVTSALLLQALALASGVATVALTAPAIWTGLDPAAGLITVAIGLAAVLGVGVLAWPAALERLQGKLPAAWPRLAPVPARVLAQGLAANGVAWVGYGAAFLCLSRALLPDVPLSLDRAIGVFAGSYLVGLIAVFAPGGLGPRESVFFLLLAEPLGPKVAVLLAVASRLLLTLTEVGAAIPFFWIGRPSPRRSTPC